MTDTTELTREIADLRKEVALYNRPMRNLGMSLLRGLGFGFGTAVGAGLLVSALASTLASADFVPVIGKWAAEIAIQIRDARP